jgi:type IV pilus assembly protein PilB
MRLESQQTSEPVLSDREQAALGVRWVQDILLEAAHLGASDIHFEPYAECYRIRFRLDGLLQTRREFPCQQATSMTAHLKVMSQLDIAERRRPQDGRMNIVLANQQRLNLRINCLPTLHGEKVVLRLLSSPTQTQAIEDLGMTDCQRQHYLKALHQPQGLILVTGPTGSGKTLTLYAGLQRLNQDHLNIVTAEDPIEMPIFGVNQVAVNHKTGLDFAQALRAFLRQDPDVIMVGEVRDRETAISAIRAAQTGLRVLSTVHTNSAAETLQRLLHMGLTPYDIAATLTLIIAQRLVRKLCLHCKQAFTLPMAAGTAEGFTEQQLGAAEFFKACGCEHCHQGYQGRVGLFEVVPISTDLAQLILTNPSASALAAAFQAAGLMQLRAAGLDAVAAGQTTLSEVNRVTQGDTCDSA